MERIIYTSLTYKELEDLIIRAIGKVAIKGSSDTDEKPISQKEAAEFLGVSLPTLIAWKKAGKIPYEQLPGSTKVRFYKSALKAAMSQKHSRHEL